MRKLVHHSVEFPALGYVIVAVPDRKDSYTAFDAGWSPEGTSAEPIKLCIWEYHEESGKELNDYLHASYAEMDAEYGAENSENKWFQGRMDRIIRAMEPRYELWKVHFEEDRINLCYLADRSDEMQYLEIRDIPYIRMQLTVTRGKGQPEEEYIIEMFNSGDFHKITVTEFWDGMMQRHIDLTPGEFGREAQVTEYLDV